MLRYLLILDRCIFLAVDRIKYASSTIVVTQRDCPSHNLPFALICQEGVILNQKLVVYYIKSLLRPGSNVLRESQISIVVLGAGLILETHLQHRGALGNYFGLFLISAASHQSGEQRWSPFGGTGINFWIG